MKNYNFETKNNNKYFDDIFETMFKICPWAAGNKKHNDTFKVGEPIYLDVEALYNKNKATNSDPFALLKPNYGTDKNLYDMFKNFANTKYDYYLTHPSYDYKYMGVPVKIHGNYIQVGSEIIPKYADYSSFEKLNNKTKLVIYNIMIDAVEITL